MGTRELASFYAVVYPLFFISCHSRIRVKWSYRLAGRCALRTGHQYSLKGHRWIASWKLMFYLWWKYSNSPVLSVCLSVFCAACQHKVGLYAKVTDMLPMRVASYMLMPYTLPVQSAYSVAQRWVKSGKINYFTFERNNLVQIQNNRKTKDRAHPTFTQQVTPDNLQCHVCSVPGSWNGSQRCQVMYAGCLGWQVMCTDRPGKERQQIQTGDKLIIFKEVLVLGNTNQVVFSLWRCGQLKK